MTSIQLPADLSDHYELLADDLDGFDSRDELVEYVLESTAAELQRSGSMEASADSADDDVVADRLEQLGYLEK